MSPFSLGLAAVKHTIFFGSQAQDNSLEENIEVFLSRYNRSTSKEIQHLPFWICWQLWKSRNELIFNKEIWSTEEVIDKAKDSVDEWLSAISQDTTKQHTRQVNAQHRKSKWIPPPSDFVKVNVDGSCHLNNQFIGVGWIIRDEHGDFRLAGCSRLIHVTTPIEAEALAVLHAIQTAWCRGYRKIVIESDCKSVYDDLTTHSMIVSIDNIIIDIHSWVNNFSDIQFSLVSRESNKVADRLAKFAYTQNASVNSFTYPLCC